MAAACWTSCWPDLDPGSFHRVVSPTARHDPMLGLGWMGLDWLGHRTPEPCSGLRRSCFPQVDKKRDVLSRMIIRDIQAVSAQTAAPGNPCPGGSFSVAGAVDRSPRLNPVRRPRFVVPLNADVWHPGPTNTALPDGGLVLRVNDAPSSLPWAGALQAPQVTTSMIRFFAIFGVAMLSASLVLAASPQISVMRPTGVQRGTETEVTISGNRLDDALEIFFHTPGFELVKIENDSDRRVKATIRIADDCELGEHALRLRTKSGVTNLRTFFVGALPEIEEDAENNNSFSAPQSIPMNSTVSGVITSEDVDYYAVEVKKGERITAEIEGMRLAQSVNSLFDPYLAILDSKRFELASDDDTTLLHQDAAVSVIAPEDGTYIIMVRESSYGGDNASRYRLHVGSFPRPMAVYPAGGKAGEPTDVVFLGDPAGDIQATLTPKGQDGETVRVFAEHNDLIAPSGNPFRLSEHGNILEVEPNNTPETATPGELPLAFNGIISESGDEDWWKFTAKKDQEWQITCHARSVRSPLDPVMSIHRADGRQLAINDDDGGKLDSNLKWKAPEDGEYLIRVRDHLDRGGEEFVYRIEFARASASLAVTIPEYRRYSQDRNTIDVPQGNRYATMVSINRQNFGGNVRFIAESLPPGVAMIAPENPRSAGQWPILFEAVEDAPLGGLLTDFRVEDVEGKVSGRYMQKALMVRGGNNQEFWNYHAPQLAVAVTEAAPYRIELVQPKAPLARDGRMELKVVAHRDEGFDEPIKLEFPFRPPGISAASNATIDKGKTEVTYRVNANGNAPLESWPVLCVGQSDVSGVLWVATQFVDLKVVEPPVAVELERAAVEQGQTARIIANITVHDAFEGEAELSLVGLPDALRPEPLKFKADTEQVVFEIPTDESTNPNKYRNLFVEYKIDHEGEPIIGKQGSTELQVDKPLPKPAPKPKAEDKKPEEPKEKPLSRLERHRQAAAEAAQQPAEE